jgi:hypothetical protein
MGTSISFRHSRRKATWPNQAIAIQHVLRIPSERNSEKLGLALSALASQTQPRIGLKKNHEKNKGNGV